MLLRGAAGPFVATTPLLTGGADATAAGWATAGAFFALNSSAHDFGAAGLGGDALGVASASTLAGTSSVLGAGDLTDFCVVEVALGAFADLIGISGMAGMVVVRACLAIGADGGVC